MPVPWFADWYSRVPIERRWRRPRARPSSPVARAAAQVPTVVSAPSQAVLQDRFWHNHYHLEPYYVRGRSYDQYRPAFELGWLAAERYPGDFSSVRPLLERQWASQHGTSLLEWRQVEAAVHAAWERMREAEAAPEPPGPQVQALVQGLQRLNLQTAQHLENLMAQAPQGLMQQVLKRHRQECVAASAELACVCPVPVPASGESAWGGSLQRGWNTLRATWGGRSAYTLLDTSQQAEEMLLLAYGAALRQGLPEPLRTTLQRQAMRVQRAMDALQWLRTCMPE